MNTRITQVDKSFNSNQQNENQCQKFSYASYVTSQNNRQFGKEITNQMKTSNECDPLQNQFSFFQQQHQKLKQQNNQLKKLPTSSALTNFPFGYNRSKSTSAPTESVHIKRLSTRGYQEESAFVIEEEFDRKPEQVIPYVNEIYSYLVEQESYYLPSQNYMSFQTDITASMRSILIDWLVDVHLKFKLVPETLFLTVNLIDRNNVLRTKLQLVGVAAMFIACKYEEIYPPDVKDFVYVCDRTYAKEEILDMESKILSSMEFNLTHTSSLRFLERQITGANLCERVSQTARMIVELSLLDMKYLKYPPSLQATAAILLGINLLKSPQILPQSLYFHDVSTQQEELKQCLSETLILLQSLKKDNLSAVKRKYNQEIFGKVSEVICNIIK